MRKTNKLSILAWLANICVFTLSLAPIADQIPRPLERSDLVYHGLAYATLSYLYTRSTKKHKFFVLVALILQGIIIEFLQPRFGRYFEAYDMVANTAGVILGFYISRFPSVRSSTAPSK